LNRRAIDCFTRSYETSTALILVDHRKRV